MPQNPNKPQEIEEALTEMAAGDSDNDWEVYLDPSTGQMRFMRRGSQQVPGAFPVQPIATTGFAANERSI
ncbi:MAG: hypothetical protein JWO48_3447 [Bryobacterales bacterium]|nr:hypothetical protein [Bryobacterales bacterium]